MSTAIKVENLSKAYQLGTIGTGTISRDLERWIAKVRGKEDPFLSIAEANDRTVKSTSGVVLSLNDVSFDIQQGDAVGIIGRNGAGKSTLLKLLSRVTSPTSGSIKVKGRIASLLEVGTGFHPELTGRENIFLNGAILGMRKKEIRRKFDEIVDFAGVERYIDTPVKRYSSGMYVRLAFAVAAHLESEILIVDEVLAVGDAEFQKKCLGKMGDVSKAEGRTVLFVSHNMLAIESFCKNAILMDRGKIKVQGEAFEIVKEYYNLNKDSNSLPYYQSDKGYLRELKLYNDNNSSFFNIEEELYIELAIFRKDNLKKFLLSLDLLSSNGTIVNSARYFYSNEIEISSLIKLKCTIPKNFLNTENYLFSVYISDSNNAPLEAVSDIAHFEMKEKRNEEFFGGINGLVRVDLKWTSLQ